MEPQPLTFKEIQCKTALVKCNIPGIDYVINPYMGCRFGCAYCYASFMGRFIEGVTGKDWGNYVYAKTNIADVLEKELPKKLKNKGAGKEVFLSSVTDPYQGMEVKYKLTRQGLVKLADYGFEGTLSILTKSKLVTRDIDVLKRFKHPSVGLTVTSTDDKISRYFEKYAPNVNERFEALRELNSHGIKTYAFVGPLLPHFVANANELEKIFIKLKEIGTRDIFVEHLNLSRYIKERLFEEPDLDQKELTKKSYDSQSKEYRTELDKIVKALVKKYDMRLLLDIVIFHKEFGDAQIKTSIPKPA